MRASDVVKDELKDEISSDHETDAAKQQRADDFKHEDELLTARAEAEADESDSDNAPVATCLQTGAPSAASSSTTATSLETMKSSFDAVKPSGQALSEGWQGIFKR
jgi:hypothetical protein